MTAGAIIAASAAVPAALLTVEHVEDLLEHRPGEEILRLVGERERPLDRGSQGMGGVASRRVGIVRDDAFQIVADALCGEAARAR